MTKSLVLSVLIKTDSLEMVLGECVQENGRVSPQCWGLRCSHDLIVSPHTLLINQPKMQLISRVSGCKAWESSSIAHVTYCQEQLNLPSSCRNRQSQVVDFPQRKWDVAFTEIKILGTLLDWRRPPRQGRPAKSLCVTPTCLPMGKNTHYKAFYWDNGGYSKWMLYSTVLYQCELFEWDTIGIVVTQHKVYLLGMLAEALSNDSHNFYNLF